MWNAIISVWAIYVQKQRSQLKWNTTQCFTRVLELSSYYSFYLVRKQHIALKLLLQNTLWNNKTSYKCYNMLLRLWYSNSKVIFFFYALFSFLCSKSQSLDKSKSYQIKYHGIIWNLGWIIGSKLLYLPFLLLLFLSEGPSCNVSKSIRFCNLKILKSK